MLYISRAYQLLEQAAELNHTKAREMVAMALLFGNHMRPNLVRAKKIFEALASEGSPGGQMVSCNDGACTFVFVIIIYEVCMTKYY